MKTTRESAATSTPLTISHSIVRGYIQVLHKWGVQEKVAAKLPEHIAKHVRKVPLPIGWMPATDSRVLYAAIREVMGEREALRRLGFEAGRDGGGWIAPLVKGLLSLFGRTPHSIFSNFSALTELSSHGLTAKWVPEGPTSGWLVLTASEPQTDDFAAVIEGSCMHACTLAGGSGEAASTLEDEGRTVRTRISWKLEEGSGS